VQRLSEFLALPSHLEEARRLGIRERLARAKQELERVSSSEYISELQGTIGADPIHGGLEATRVLRSSGQRELTAFN
jgi:hypothetical protein